MSLQKILFLLKLSVPVAIVILAGSLVLAGTVVFILFFLIFRKQWSIKKSTLLLHLHYDREILKSKLESQEQTLNEVSAEIHDNVGQQLSLVNFYLEGLQERGTAVGHILPLLRKSIADLRHLSHSFGSRLLSEEGLEATIRIQLAELNQSKKIQAVLEANTGYRGIDSDVEFILYRVFQEGLQNILKHADATEIKVCLENTPDKLIMTIGDNGKGFSTATSKGDGLKNMKARIKILKGEFSAESGGDGTILTIKIPIRR